MICLKDASLERTPLLSSDSPTVIKFSLWTSKRTADPVVIAVGDNNVPCIGLHVLGKSVAISVSVSDIC